MLNGTCSPAVECSAQQNCVCGTLDSVLGGDDDPALEAGSGCLHVINLTVTVQPVATTTNSNLSG